MVDIGAIMSLEIIAVKEQAKVYGPVIQRLVARSAAQFVAQKLNEPTPEVNTLDESVKYIKKSQERYPKAFTALGYGVIKAQSMLEGNSGAGTRLFKTLMKKIMESMGLRKIIGNVSGTFDAIARNTKFNEDMNVVDKGISKVSGDSETAYNVITGCDYIDVCGKLIQERISRAIVGGSECTYALSDVAAAAILTGTQHDYRVLKFEPPICEYKVFKLD